MFACLLELAEDARANQSGARHDGAEGHGEQGLEGNVGDRVVGHGANDGNGGSEGSEGGKQKGRGAAVDDAAGQGEEGRGRVHGQVEQGQELLALALHQLESPQAVGLLEQGPQRRELDARAVKLAQQPQLGRLSVVA